MATITNNLISQSGTAIIMFDLALAPHNFNFSIKQQVLHIDNRESGSLTVNLKGDGATIFACEGVENKDVSAGLNIAVSSDEHIFINTFTRRGYFGVHGNNVVVTVTGTTTGLSHIWLTSK